MLGAMRHAAAAVAITAALFLLGGCLETERREIPVTPGVVPEEIQGAAWEDFPINYCVVNQPDGGFVQHEVFVRLTQQAFTAWGVPSRFEGDCPEGIQRGNGRNEIGWGRLETPGASIHQAGQTSIRFRQRALGGGGPEIVEADIVVESDPPRGLRTEECLYTTLLHEVGHFLGAHHIAPPAVMAAALTDCPQKLTEADQALIRELYGEFD
jgi:hypothetical protein